MEKREPITHEIKCAPPYFDEVWHGRKRFEVRKDDRDYQAGDTVVLREFVGGDYTTKSCVFQAGYVLRGYYGIRAGYCAFGLDDQVAPSEPGSYQFNLRKLIVEALRCGRGYVGAAITDAGKRSTFSSAETATADLEMIKCAIALAESDRTDITIRGRS